MRSIRGMHDILPNDILYWQYIYKTAISVLGNANYREIRTPILEATDLFVRSIGEGTDIINKEMYTFEDQNQRKITLRPEGTASIARSFIQHHLFQHNQVQRLWYLGPMFRYERPQQGRQRQFHQLGIECIGSSNPFAEAEIIHLACEFLNKLTCTDYMLEINSIGSISNRQKYEQALITFLTKYINDLDTDSKLRLQTNPIKILDSKNPNTQQILQDAPKLINFLDIEARIHFDQVIDYINALKIPFQLNHKLVRGLDYYNYTAFEIKSNALGAQNTICGGGRYDQLIEQLGGPNTPSVGWAIGVERLLLIIKDTLKIDKHKQLIYIITKSHDAKKYILSILPILQQYKLKFELDLSENNFQKQIKKANKKEAYICLIAGHDEVKNATITIKWLKTHQQKIISISSLEEEIKQIKIPELH